MNYKTIKCTVELEVNTAGTEEDLKSAVVSGVVRQLDYKGFGLKYADEIKVRTEVLDSVDMAAEFSYLVEHKTELKQYVVIGTRYQHACVAGYPPMYIHMKDITVLSEIGPLTEEEKKFFKNNYQQ